MKKILVSLILIMLVSACFAGSTSVNIASKPTADWFRNGGAKDLGWRWMQEADALLSIGNTLGTGNIFYVDSGVTNAGDGSNWANAVATLDEAINLCTANAGDVILVAQNHAETIAAADGFDADVAGITIIGCGRGTDTPEFTFSATASTAAVGAANVTIVNLRFIAGISEVVTGIVVEDAGDNFTMFGCEFPQPTSGYEFDIAVSVSANANGVRISNCIARCSLATGATAWADFSDSNDTTVENCDVYGEYSSAPIYSNSISFNTMIRNNVVSNLTSGEFGIEFTAATTGTYGNNWVYTNGGTTAIDPGSMKAVAPNWIVTAVDKSPVIFPAQDDTAENLIGVNDSDNAADTSSVAANATGSILERLEAQKSANGTAVDANLAAIIRFVTLQDANSKILVTFAGAQDANIQQIENFAALNDANSKILVTFAGVQDANIQQIENFAALNDANSKTLVTAAGLHDANFTLITAWRGAQDANIQQIEAFAALQDVNILQLEGAALPSKNHPNYFTVDANMTSATWNTVAVHQLVAVTGAVRIVLMAELTADEALVSAGTNATITLGFVGNAAAIWAAAAIDTWDLTEVAMGVVAGVPTFPVAGGGATGDLTHCLFDFIATSGVDVVYEIGVSAGTKGTIRWHIWWTPLSSTGLCTAGAGT